MIGEHLRIIEGDGVLKMGPRDEGSGGTGTFCTEKYAGFHQ